MTLRRTKSRWRAQPSSCAGVHLPLPHLLCRDSSCWHFNLPDFGKSKAGSRGLLALGTVLRGMDRNICHTEDRTAAQSELCLQAWAGIVARALMPVLGCPGCRRDGAPTAWGAAGFPFSALEMGTGGPQEAKLAQMHFSEPCAKAEGQLLVLLLSTWLSLDTLGSPSLVMS